LRPLSPQFRSFPWAISTAEAARIAGIEPRDVLRFDGNTMPTPPASARPETIAAALGSIQSYAHGGHPELLHAIADYVGVGPEHVVLGAGADDLIMLCGRSFAGPGDRVAIADEPTYPMYRIAAWVAGAEVSDESPVLTFCCRPHNPTGALVDLPTGRPLVVDEAYFEFCRDSAASLLDDGVIVIRTFSKAFGLASARIGYAIAAGETAAKLNARQSPAPVSTLAVSLALAGLESPPDVGPTLEERERLAARLRELGLEPLPSVTNFLFVPLPEARAVEQALLRRGLLVRGYDSGIRITVRDVRDDDRLVDEIAAILV
jgi:histidinol-phosphate aminotransferase